METAGELGFLSKLSPEDLEALKHLIVRQMEETNRTNALLQRLSVEAVRSELVNETLAIVTAKTGLSDEDALVMALTLYDVAVDAMGQGQRLVLVDQDYRFVREVTGFLKKALGSMSHEKVAG